ncbi:MAG TPA: pyridoxamine 5'-phosphate oxidase family protein [Acidimicrobiales bacterium]|nr:pyridoxamine 5'-phosphate oxidase family protein [Acidimicrobiales bacterium]
MSTTGGRTWLEHVGVDECWRLLASTPVGRLGVLNDSAPEIYPVNHAVDGRTIVFRTDPGCMLRAIDRSPAVCFQVDGLDPEDETGWSVLVKGRAAEVADEVEQRRLAELPLRYWSIGEKVHWVRVMAHEVTGRRIWKGDGLGRTAG